MGTRATWRRTPHTCALWRGTAVVRMVVIEVGLLCRLRTGVSVRASQGSNAGDMCWAQSPDTAVSSPHMARGEYPCGRPAAAPTPSTARAAGMGSSCQTPQSCFHPSPNFLFSAPKLFFAVQQICLPYCWRGGKTVLTLPFSVIAPQLCIFLNHGALSRSQWQQSHSR